MMSGRAPDTLTRSDDWTHRAACTEDDSGVYFDERNPRLAKARCAGCPVREECLADAMAWESKRGHDRHGVYGGLTADEREDLAADMSKVTGRKPARCPSEAAYKRHLRDGEFIDPGCRQAHADAARAYNAALRAQV